MGTGFSAGAGSANGSMAGGSGCFSVSGAGPSAGATGLTSTGLTSTGGCSWVTGWTFAAGDTGWRSGTGAGTGVGATVSGNVRSGSCWAMAGKDRGVSRTTSGRAAPGAGVGTAMTADCSIASATGMLASPQQATGGPHGISS